MFPQFKLREILQTLALTHTPIERDPKCLQSMYLIEYCMKVHSIYTTNAVSNESLHVIQIQHMCI